MQYAELSTKISALRVRFKSDREFFLAQSGLAGCYSLGEPGSPGYLLMDATPEEILEYVQSVCQK